MTMFITQNLLVSPSFHTTPSLSSFTTKTHFKAPIFGSIPSPTLTRRLFIPSVSTIWDAFTGANNNNPREAMLAIRRGMVLFRKGDVLESVVEFDKAIQLDSRQKAYLWQRGLSLYYLDRFEEGAEQFRLDVAQNPNDTEESIWCFLCEAQLYGVDEARKRYLEVGRDPRPVMREAYNMFKDGGDPEKVCNTHPFSVPRIKGYDINSFLLHYWYSKMPSPFTKCNLSLTRAIDLPVQLVAAFSNSRESDYFYASLYAGLFYESQNETDAAKVHMVAAYQSSYGQRSDDYMASLSKVHCQCRNWVMN